MTSPRDVVRAVLATVTGPRPIRAARRRHASRPRLSRAAAQPAVHERPRAELGRGAEPRRAGAAAPRGNHVGRPRPSRERTARAGRQRGLVRRRPRAEVVRRCGRNGLVRRRPLRGGQRRDLQGRYERCHRRGGVRDRRAERQDRPRRPPGRAREQAGSPPPRRGFGRRRRPRRTRRPRSTAKARADRGARRRTGARRRAGQGRRGCEGGPRRRRSRCSPRKSRPRRSA